MNKICIWLIGGFMLVFRANTQDIRPGKDIPAWQPGYLDLHHINTGRGSAAYFIFPDGTTMLLDAGEMSPINSRTLGPRNSPITPDSTIKPFQWIVRYIKKVAPPFNKDSIDYGLITHFHDDHFGAWYPQAPRSANGQFVLTGITGVSELMPIHTLIDRGYPAYDYPYDMKKWSIREESTNAHAKTIHNYFAFIKARLEAGLKMSLLNVGSKKQIRLLRNSNSFTNFYIRNVKSNQWIWTGRDSAVYKHFPSHDDHPAKPWPDENSLSLAITIHYGPFVYYTGGDNPGNVYPGDNPLRDVETPIAKAVGEVDIATMDHHGNRDAVNEYMIKTFKPTIWIGQTWSSDHPGHEVLLRITNPHIYPGKRDIFSTNMLEANRIVIGPLIDRSYKSQQGHIVVRVMPGGDHYYIIILDDRDAGMPVKSVFGPYASKQNKRPG